MSRVWIPGWQFDEQALSPLFSLLEAQDEKVLNYHSYSGSRQHWLQSQVDALAENTTLIGWSLGGMLACELAQQTDKVQKVLLINANVKFAGGPGLPCAVAEDFRQRYGVNPAATRRRFASLVDATKSRSITKLLLDGDRSDTLAWLYDIDLSELKLSCPLHILLAENDQLVPLNSAMKAWSELADSVTSMAGEHGGFIHEGSVVAQWIDSHG